MRAAECGGGWELGSHGRLQHQARQRRVQHAGRLNAGAHLQVRTPPAATQRVPGILRTVVKEEGLGGLPLYSFGGSSGGSFALRVAAAMEEVKVRARQSVNAAAGNQPERASVRPGFAGARLVQE